MKKKVNIKKIWISGAIITLLIIAHLTVKNEIYNLKTNIDVVKSEIEGIVDKNKKLRKKIRNEYGEKYIVDEAKDKLKMRKMKDNEVVIEIYSR